MNEQPRFKPGKGPDLAAFSWEDPLLLDASLDEDERMVADAARAFAQERLQPRVIAAYRDEASDQREVARGRESGFHAPILP